MRRRNAAGVLLTALLLLVLPALSARALASPSTDPYPPSQCATLTVDRTQIPVGGGITVSGTGLRPGVTVKLRIDPSTLNINLGTVRVGADGTFSVTVVLPAIPSGPHFIYAVDGRTSSCGVDPSAQMFAVEAVNADRSGGSTTAGQAAGGPGADTTSATQGGALSSTGVAITIAIAAALALIAAGVLLLGGSHASRRGFRRRRSA